MASYHLVLLCLYTESQYVPVRHTVENGYVFLTFFHPSTACLRVMSHVYSAFIFFLFSTRFDWLRARNQIRLCIYSISHHFLDALSSGLAWVSGLPKGARGEEILDGGALSLFRFHLSPFPPETPDTLATSGHIALLFFNSLHGKHTFEIILLHYCLPSFTNSLPKFICSARSLPLFLMKKVKFNS